MSKNLAPEVVALLTEYPSKWPSQYPSRTIGSPSNDDEPSTAVEANAFRSALANVGADPRLSSPRQHNAIAPMTATHSPQNASFVGEVVIGGCLRQRLVHLLRGWKPRYKLELCRPLDAASSPSWLSIQPGDIRFGPIESDRRGFPTRGIGFPAHFSTVFGSGVLTTIRP